MAPLTRTTLKSCLYQACAAEVHYPPDIDSLKQFKARADPLNLPFSTLIDHAIEKQPLSTIDTKFGLTYSISALAIHQHEHTNKEILLSITDCVQPIYSKDSMTYPPFPLKPMPTLSELNLSNDNVWWSTVIIVNDNDSVALEAGTTGQRSSQQWRDAHVKRISASQVGSILNRVRAPTEPFLRNLFNSFNNSQNSVVPRSIQHGIENESKALNEYKKAMLSKGFDVQIFTPGFVTQPDYFWLGATPDAKVRCCKENQVTFGIAEVKCPYSARFLKPSEATVLKNFFTTNDSGFPKLNQNHSYFHQVQTQLFLTQSPWCDFIVFTFKGLSIERIFPSQNWVLENVPVLKNFYCEYAIPFFKDAPVNIPTFEQSSSEEEQDDCCDEVSLCSEDDDEDFV
jgi:hypothetical protein